MNINYSVEDLIQFEREVADAYNDHQFGSGRIHLHSGGEEHLIEVFRKIQPEDWLVLYWRCHYHMLLRGVMKAEIYEEIRSGRSIHPQLPNYRIVSSAIVGGNAPIAVGLALSIKRSGGSNHVHCFMGDMGAETGIVHEAIKYARNFDLPVTFHIEDNNRSVNNITSEAWGREKHTYADGGPKLDYYVCPLGRYPHGGGGKWLQFS
jgi:TPP-dependent pyruvate/acetoin dehydrogenase alpha subunit